MRKILLIGCLAWIAAVAWACNGDSSNDGGADATGEQVVDLCDINAFTGNGNPCPHASTRVCFSDPTCEAGNGCTCKDTNGSATWSCFTPPECLFPCSSSPFVDAACDAGDDAGDAAAAETGNDASDAGADGD